MCVCVCVPELCETLGADVLTGVLNSGQQVGDELVDGAFVLDGSRDTLSYFNLIALTGGWEAWDRGRGQRRRTGQ